MIKMRSKEVIEACDRAINHYRNLIKYNENLPKDSVQRIEGLEFQRTIEDTINEFRSEMSAREIVRQKLETTNELIERDFDLISNYL